MVCKGSHDPVQMVDPSAAYEGTTIYMCFRDSPIKSADVLKYA